jgi:DNA-binding Lrp family transcriptional regulator
MDKLDFCIIRCLFENSRVSYESLGRKFETTSATIKNRIRMLVNDNRLGQFSVRLNYTAFEGQKVLSVIGTDGSEDQREFIRKIGRNGFTESISPSRANKYLILSVCRNIAEYSQLQSFFDTSPEIMSNESYPIKNRLKNSFYLSEIQASILTYLIHNPRMKLSIIAELLGKSSKRISRAISKLLELNLIDFSIECYISSLNALIEYDPHQHKYEEIRIRLAKEFDNIWEVYELEKRPIIYVSFFVDHVKDIHIIEKSLRINQYNVLDCLIAEPRQYFNSLKDEELKKLMAKEDLKK